MGKEGLLSVERRQIDRKRIELFFLYDPVQDAGQVVLVLNPR